MRRVGVERFTHNPRRIFEGYNHTLFSAGNVTEACKVLSNLGADSYKPGIVSTLVALYTNLENTEGAIGVLDKAVEWYKREGVSGKEAVQSLQDVFCLLFFPIWRVVT